MTGICARCGSDADPKADYIPTADEAFRFIQSNPATSMNMVAKALNISKDDPWSRGFAACLYLLNDRYPDYRRERDQWLKEKYK
jgi:hypothetical protein